MMYYVKEWPDGEDCYLGIGQRIERSEAGMAH